MAPGLAFRILAHLEELGLLQPGGTVLDPMGGIGTTGLCAALLGHPAVLVELEEKFVGLARRNAERIVLKGFGAPIEVIQGDARRLSELLGERETVSLTSPPYQNRTPAGRRFYSHKDRSQPLAKDREEEIHSGYGTTEGQIGALPDAPITITSPPYAEAQEGGGIVKKGYKDTGDMVADRTGYRAKGLTPENIALLPDSGGALGEEAGSSPATRGGRGRRMASNQVHPQNPLPDTVTLISPPYSQTDSRSGGINWDKAGRPERLAPSEKRHSVESGAGEWRYGDAEGQIGALPDAPITMTSPPYQNSNLSRGDTWQGKFGGPHSQVRGQDYGTTEGQIGALPDTVTLISPPYEDSDNRGPSDGIDSPEWRARRKSAGALRPMNPKSEGQIGQERQESYLDAMASVYSEIAKVSPVLVVVVKDPTRNGRLRFLGRDTWLLMEQCGYKIVDYHQAILFEEQTQGHLFDGSVKKPKGRLGFFKRLAYRKGAEIASYEHVLIGVKREVVA